MKVSAVIPALNEETAIAKVVGAIPRSVSEIIVVDNGSTDKTAEIAANAGARVLREPAKGYGAACLAGLAAVADTSEIVVFLDGDYSDFPEELTRLVRPIEQNEADLVILRWISQSKILQARRPKLADPHPNGTKRR